MWGKFKERGMVVDCGSTIEWRMGLIVQGKFKNLRRKGGVGGRGAF